jgi:hypothetical protein
MDRLDKLPGRARRSPAGLSFAEFETMMSLAKWGLDRQRGSHRVWYSPKGHRLPIQPVGRKAKAYQVRQFLAQYDRENFDG